MLSPHLPPLSPCPTCHVATRLVSDLTTDQIYTNPTKQTQPSCVVQTPTCGAKKKCTAREHNTKTKLKENVNGPPCMDPKMQREGKVLNGQGVDKRWSRVL